MKYLVILIALVAMACTDAPLVTLQPIKVNANAVWLSRVVQPQQLITVGGDEVMQVTAFDGMNATGGMLAHVSRGMVGTMARYHAAGESVTIVVSR